MARQCLNEYNLCVVILVHKLARRLGARRQERGPQLPLHNVT